MDGAYDQGPTCDVLAERFGPIVKVTIPPPKNAALSPNATQHPTIRYCHISGIQAHGRMAWQKTSSYNQLSRIEIRLG